MARKTIQKFFPKTEFSPADVAAANKIFIDVAGSLIREGISPSMMLTLFVTWASNIFAAFERRGYFDHHPWPKSGWEQLASGSYDLSTSPENREAVDWLCDLIGSLER